MTTDDYVKIWTIISVIILLFTIGLGVKYQKNIYKIVVWNLLSYLAIPFIIQLIAFTIQLSNSKSEYEKADIGETMTVKGLLDFHLEDLCCGDSMIFILPPDSMVDNKIIRSDSTRFTITIPDKTTGSSHHGTVIYIRSDKTQTRKFKDIDISELIKDTKQIEITFLGKKTDVNSWDCINIISIDKINSDSFTYSLY